MAGRLIASIHDVGPRFESEVDRLADHLGAVLGEARFAMLVVPDHWGVAPLGAAPAFRSRLRRWAEQGVEMFVHGWFHKDSAEHTGAAHAGLASFKARHMTAGEGEFLGLGQEEAARRMAAGRALIEDAIGREVAGFIAPAWLYGPGAHAALAQSGFRMAEDHMKVWDPTSGAVLARGPVVTWASRSRPRQLSSLAVAGLARATFHVLPTVRLAVHPGDTAVPGLMASIGATCACFAARRPAGRYADLRDQFSPV